MEDPILKHLLYTQALCEITLEKLAIVIADTQDKNSASVKKEFISEVRLRVAELRSMNNLP